MAKKNLKIGFVQYAIRDFCVEQNSQTLIRQITKLIPQNPDLIVLPEIFLGGPKEKKDYPQYSSDYQSFLSTLKKIASQSDVHFYGSFIEKEKQDHYNTAAFIQPSPHKNLYYRKIHLFRYEGEHKTYSPGNTTPVWKSPWGCIAPLICYDIRFPESLRKQVVNGAKIALVTAQWPDSRIAHWLTLLRARAIENQIYVIACNRTGSKKHLRYNGHSCVISPWGDYLLNLNAQQITGVCEIDLNLVDKTRREFPFLKDIV